MSDRLKSSLDKLCEEYPSFRFSTFALRLAAQETRYVVVCVVIIFHSSFYNF